MPEMDGLKATRAIRSRGDAAASIPIIAFTANAFTEDVKACREAGMNDFVAKPVRKKVLVDAILRVWPGDNALVSDKPAADTQQDPFGQDLPAVGTPIFDRAVFDELAREIGPAAMSESLAVFIEETRTRLAAFRSLSCDSDRETIAREAHSLKSTAATFGLRQLAELAGLLERSAFQTTAPEYGAAVDGLAAAFERGRALLPASFSRAA
jgi:CheY-like chemotaxis protein